MFCPKCGASNDEEAVFCVKCGHAIKVETSADKKTDAKKKAMLSKGHVLDNRYEIIEIIEKGGMGAVYRAMDHRLDNFCAVKEMRENFEREEYRKYAIEKFKSEALILSKLRHNNIPRVWDYFIEDNRYYLVMDFVEGITLHKIMHSRPKRRCEEEEVVHWAIQVCDVLSYLHHRDPPIVYRDIKPANVMINPDGRVMLIDFGIARIFSPKKKGTMIGTQGYAPPEQYRGRVDTRSDIYALGATMHHLLTGKDPQLDAPFNFPPVKKLRSEVSNTTANIIARCLKFSPDERYASIDELKQALMEDSAGKEISLNLEQPAPAVDLNIPGLETPVEEEIEPSAFPAQKMKRTNSIPKIMGARKKTSRKTGRTKSGELNELARLLSDLDETTPEVEAPPAPVIEKPAPSEDLFTPTEETFAPVEEPAMPVEEKKPVKEESFFSVEEILSPVVEKQPEPIQKPAQKDNDLPPKFQEMSKKFREEMMAEGFIELPVSPLEEPTPTKIVPDSEELFKDFEDIEDLDAYEDEDSSGELGEPGLPKGFEITEPSLEDEEEEDEEEFAPPRQNPTVSSDPIPRPTVPFAPLEIKLPRKKPRTKIPDEKPVHRPVVPPEHHPAPVHPAPPKAPVPPAPPVPVGQAEFEISAMTGQSSMPVPDLSPFSDQNFIPEIKIPQAPRPVEKMVTPGVRPVTPPPMPSFQRVEEIPRPSIAPAQVPSSPMTPGIMPPMPGVTPRAHTPAGPGMIPPPPGLGTPFSERFSPRVQEPMPSPRPVTPPMPSPFEPPRSTPEPPARPAPRPSVGGGPRVSEWNMFRGGPRHSAKNAQGRPCNGQLKWRFHTNGRIYSSPVVGVDGTVYIGSDDGCIYALTPDGNEAWRFITDGPIKATPLVVDGMGIYVGSEDKTFYALDFNGGIQWKFKTDDIIHSSANMGANGSIYFAAKDGKVYSLAPDGKLKWRYDIDTYIYSSPAMSPLGVIYFGAWDRYLYALNTDGTLKWKFKTSGAIDSSPAVDGAGYIYFGCEDNFIYSVEPLGSLKWKCKTGDEIYSSPAIDKDGSLFVGSHDNFLYCMSFDGAVKWRARTGQRIRSSPAVDGQGNVYVGSDDFAMHAIDPEGKERWKIKTFGTVESSPCITNSGMLVFGSNDGWVFAMV